LGPCSGQRYSYNRGPKVVRALGGAPTYMPPQDVYNALQAGAIEGIQAPMGILKSWNLAEVSHNTTDSSIVGYTTTNFVIMNKKRWDALPSDVQKVMEDLSERWVDLHGCEWDRMAKEVVKFTGQKIITLSEKEGWRWRTAVEPIIENYMKYTPNGDKYVNELEELMTKAYSTLKCPDGYYPCDKKCCKKKR